MREPDFKAATWDYIVERDRHLASVHLAGENSSSQEMVCLNQQ
jgi:hypothetical protein